MICPFITKCKEKVDFEHFRNVCMNITEDKYKECPIYQKLTSEKKTPSEWSSLIGGR